MAISLSYGLSFISLRRRTFNFLLFIGIIARRPPKVKGAACVAINTYKTYRKRAKKLWRYLAKKSAKKISGRVLGAVRSCFGGGAVVFWGRLLTN